MFAPGISLFLSLNDYAEQREYEKGRDHAYGDFEQGLFEATTRLVHPSVTAEHAAQTAAFALQDNQGDEHRR
jgi:hypothetical protein